MPDERSIEELVDAFEASTVAAAVFCSSGAENAKDAARATLLRAVARLREERDEYRREWESACERERARWEQERRMVGWRGGAGRGRRMTAPDNRDPAYAGVCRCGRPTYRDAGVVHVCDPAREFPDGVRCARCNRDISAAGEPKLRLPADAGWDAAGPPVYGIVCVECWTSGGVT